ncbi:MAG: blue (type 1) copper domain protein [Frankiales bacterium]|nr:blue (type 1) copper domain protein [Frankiales bacterium]
MKRTLTAAGVAVLLVGCGGGSSKVNSGSATTGGAPGAQTVTVTMRDSLSFSPGTVNAKVGTLTLNVSNTGLVPHNLVFADAALGRTKTVNGKESVPLRVVFDKPGTFTFMCTFHSGMVGKVVVS